MSALTIVQNAALRVGVPSPTSAIGSSDHNARQMLALAQQEGKELARRFSWQALTNEQTITATATEEQANAIPDGFDRFLPNTFFNRTRNRIVAGPLTPQDWQDLKGRSATVVYDAFRQRGDALLMMPVPTAGQTYAFEYITKYWATDADGTNAKAEFESDTDAALLDEELMTDGVVWRWRQAKGLDYAEAFRTFEVQLKQAMARDGGSRHVNVATHSDLRRPRYPLFPDSSWNL